MPFDCFYGTALPHDSEPILGVEFQTYANELVTVAPFPFLLF